MTWENPSYIVLPIYAVIVVVGIYLILKLAKDKTSKVSSSETFRSNIRRLCCFYGAYFGSI